MKIGIIGGSGLYQLDPSRPCEALAVDTPFGYPSGKIYEIPFGQNTAYFLARHGQGHTLTPSEINYRANVYAFKKLGVSTLLSISAVGSMKKEIAPGQFVLPDQYIDFTQGSRISTFFGRGIVAHAHFADPACATLRKHIHQVCIDEKIPVHQNGTYICIEGPQFSTRSESLLYRSFALSKTNSVDVIGMTAMPEAKLAREAGICYQTVAMATDYDCWNEEAHDVTLDAVMETLKNNIDTSRRMILKLLSGSFPNCEKGCRTSMKNAIVTARELWPDTRRDELNTLLNADN